MRPSTLITSLTLGYATARGSPVASIEAARSEPGHVTDASGTPYALYETDSNDIHVITNKINGEFMKPVNYTINANHVCTFWSESTRGVGYLIGAFEGPVEGGFGSDWAAFFECCARHGE